MSHSISVFPPPPTRHDSVQRRRHSVMRPIDGLSPDLTSTGNSFPASSSTDYPVAASSPYIVPSEHLTRTHRPPALNLIPSSHLDAPPASPRSLASSLNGEQNPSTPPDSPDATAFVSDAVQRREKMKRVTRLLGEGVPSHLVFPDNASINIDDEERPLLAAKTRRSKPHSHSRRETMSGRVAHASNARGKEPIRAWNGPIPFDEMCGPWQRC